MKPMPPVTNTFRPRLLDAMTKDVQEFKSSRIIAMEQKLRARTARKVAIAMPWLLPLHSRAVGRNVGCHVAPWL